MLEPVETEQLRFDYSLVADDVREAVQEDTRLIHRTVAGSVITIGQALLRTKERLGHGLFGQWLAAEFAWTVRTAQRLMSVPENLKYDNLSQLAIGRSALFLLAETQTPESVRDRALALAESGVRVTHAMVRELLEPDIVVDLDTKARIGHAILDELTAAGVGVDVRTDPVSGQDILVRDDDGGITPAARDWILAEVPEEWSAGGRLEYDDDMVIGLAGEAVMEYMQEWAPDEQGEEEEEDEGGAPVRLADHQLIHSSKTVEWYTPPEYLALVREVLGPIELDPASTPAANQFVQAERFYTAAQDGMRQEWRARTVFCNPPYGKWRNLSVAGLFAGKLIAACEAGDVAEAILLVCANTGTEWFQPLFRYPICFAEDRIAFIDKNLVEQRSPSAQNAFVYLGPKPERFLSVFRAIGSVVRLVEDR
jgi:hypothetical protein